MVAAKAQGQKDEVSLGLAGKPVWLRIQSLCTKS